MKFLVSLALAFFLSTFGFVVVHNVVHHEDEPIATLPGQLLAPTKSATSTTSSAPPTSRPSVTAPAQTALPPAGFATTSTTGAQLEPTTVATTQVASATIPPTSATPKPTPAAATNPSTTLAAELPHTARLALTQGTTSNSNVADGRATSGKLVVTNGTGTAETIAEKRQVKVSASSNSGDGRSIWFALLGSNITLTQGTQSTAKVAIRIDGVTWKGILSSDGGTAAAEIRLQIQDSDGLELANVVIDEATQASAGTQSFASTGTSASAEVAVSVNSKPVVLRAFLYVKTDAQGGSGKTFADLTSGVSFASIAVAVGAPPPPTTAAPAPRAPGSGITAQQLAQHTTAESCWLLIQGRVYDMTPYLRRHPGSQLPVLKVCGKEATDAFLTQGGRGSRHSYEAIDKMEGLYIGDYIG